MKLSMSFRRRTPRSTFRPRLLSAFLLFSLAASAGIAHAGVPGYEYVSPVPGSHLLSVGNNVIFRHGPPIDVATVQPGLLEVTGSASGAHAGALELSDDAKTLIFTPATPYALDEAVTVTLLPGVRTTSGDDLPPLAFQFFTTPQTLAAPSLARSGAAALEAAPPEESPAAPPGDAAPLTALATCGALPASYPTPSLLYSNSPEPGCIFLSPFIMATAPSASGHLMIIDNHANPIYWRSMTPRPGEFRMLADGRLSYVSAPNNYIMDSSYAVVDSFTTGNGYLIDGHEFQMLPNGHVMLMALDPEPVRMDSIVPGGQPGAIVEGLVLQELDLARRVVFQWRSWDHMAITDCVSPTVNLLAMDVDYVHGNSIELDHDGNWLVSSRHLNEITKINRTTGDIIWRMGLHAARNDFTFLNDSRGFSHQHDARRLPNGHILVFDNGNYLSPQYSRAIEYDVDEVNRTVRLVWQYRTNPDTFGGFMGGAQRRESGGTMIGWGGNQTTGLRVSDLHADGSRALELGLKARTYIYRAYRFPWRTTRFVPHPSTLDFADVPFGSAMVSRHTFVRNESAAEVTIHCTLSSSAAFSVPTPFPITLAPGDSADVEVQFDTTYVGIFNERLYLRSVSDSEVVVATVALSMVPRVDVSGAANPARFAFHDGGPNPFRGSTTLRFDLPRASFVELAVFDVRGRKVDTVVSGLRMAGRHEVAWSPERAPDGVYFCRFSAGGMVATRKIVRVN